MTREELIAYGKDYLRDLVSAVCEISEKHKEFVRMSIKALEQEPVLDKIMEEIEQVKSIMNEEIINNNRKDLINFVNGLNQSLVIIERCKAESEDKE